MFPALSDLMQKRYMMLVLVLALEICILVPAIFSYAFMPIAIIVINATYGSFFALLPSVLSDHYGNKDLSTRHSAILSAWGIASLFAYLITTFALKFLNGYEMLPIILAVVYAVNLVNVISMKQQKA